MVTFGVGLELPFIPLSPTLTPFLSFFSGSLVYPFHPKLQCFYIQKNFQCVTPPPMPLSSTRPSKNISFRTIQKLSLLDLIMYVLLSPTKLLFFDCSNLFSVFPLDRLLRISGSGIGPTSPMRSLMHNTGGKRSGSALSRKCFA